MWRPSNWQDPLTQVKSLKKPEIPSEQYNRQYRCHDENVKRSDTEYRWYVSFALVHCVCMMCAIQITCRNNWQCVAVEIIIHLEILRAVTKKRVWQRSVLLYVVTVFAGLVTIATTTKMTNRFTRIKSFHV